MLYLAYVRLFFPLSLVSAASEESKRSPRKFSVKKTLKLNKLKNKGNHLSFAGSFPSQMPYLFKAIQSVMEVTRYFCPHVMQARRREAREPLLAKYLLLIRCWNECKSLNHRRISFFFLISFPNLVSLMFFLKRSHFVFWPGIGFCYMSNLQYYYLLVSGPVL